MGKFRVNKAWLQIMNITFSILSLHKTIANVTKTDLT
jgi:hypothetical protein